MAPVDLQAENDKLRGLPWCPLQVPANPEGDRSAGPQFYYKYRFVSADEDITDDTVCYSFVITDLKRVWMRFSTRKDVADEKKLYNRQLHEEPENIPKLLYSYFLSPTMKTTSSHEFDWTIDEEDTLQLKCSTKIKRMYFTWIFACQTLRFSFCPLLSKSSTYLADHFIRPLLLLEDELSRELDAVLKLAASFAGMADKRFDEESWRETRLNSSDFAENCIKSTFPKMSPAAIDILRHASLHTCQAARQGGKRRRGNGMVVKSLSSENDRSRRRVEEDSEESVPDFFTMDSQPSEAFSPSQLPSKDHGEEESGDEECQGSEGNGHNRTNSIDESPEEIRRRLEIERDLEEKRKKKQEKAKKKKKKKSFV